MPTLQPDCGMIRMSHCPARIDVRVPDHDSPGLLSHSLKVGLHCRVVFGLSQDLVARDINRFAAVAIEFLNPVRLVSWSFAHWFVLQNEFGANVLADWNEEPFALPFEHNV